MDLSDCEMGEAAKWIELYGYIRENMDEFLNYLSTVVVIPSFFYQTIVQTSIHSWWNRLDLPAICYVESPFVGPFVKKATLYIPEMFSQGTQEIIH